jgi:hypothetical protein
MKVEVEIDQQAKGCNYISDGKGPANSDAPTTTVHQVIG